MDELKTSKDRPSRKVLKSQRIKIVHSEKKRKLSPTEETDGNECVSANPERKGSAMETELINNPQSDTNISRSQKSGWKVRAGERDNASFCISHIMPATPEEKSKSDGVNVPCSTDQHQKSPRNINSESQPSKKQTVIQPNNQDAAVNGSSRGASWIQKSSWTQLVGETNSSFSISQLLPGMNLEKQERVKPKSTDMRNSTVGKNFELVKSGRSESSKDDSKALGLGNEGMDISTTPCSSNMVPVKNQETSGKSNEINASKKMHTAQVHAQQPIKNNPTGGENYSFMRSAASMRDWMNAKASLSGSLKKKRKIERSK